MIAVIHTVHIYSKLIFPSISLVLGCNTYHGVSINLNCISLSLSIECCDLFLLLVRTNNCVTFGACLYFFCNIFFGSFLFTVNLIVVHSILRPSCLPFGNTKAIIYLEKRYGERRTLVMDGFGDNFDQADVDPAAEFLAREKDQLAGLVDDMGGLVIPPATESNASDEAPANSGKYSNKKERKSKKKKKLKNFPFSIQKSATMCHCSSQLLVTYLIFIRVLERNNSIISVEHFCICLMTDLEPFKGRSKHVRLELVCDCTHKMTSVSIAITENRIHCVNWHGVIRFGHRDEN